MNQNQKSKANKRKALKILLAAAILLTTLILLRSCGGTDGADSPEGRQTFLRQLGWEIDPESEDMRTVQLPNKLEGMLQKYNELQLKQGYDLNKHLGESCKQYSYLVLNHPVRDQTVWRPFTFRGIRSLPATSTVPLSTVFSRD